MICMLFRGLRVFYIDMSMNMSEFIACIHHACAVSINQHLHTKAIYSHHHISDVWLKHVCLHEFPDNENIGSPYTAAHGLRHQTVYSNEYDFET